MDWLALVIVAVLWPTQVPAPTADAQVLLVPGHAPSAFVAPRSPGMRPVLLVLHGNADRPEWICPVFAQLAAHRAWVVCPRGVLRRDVPAQLDRWNFGTMAAVRTEADAALEALKARFPGRVDLDKPVIAGFSLGGYLSSRLAVEQPGRFPRLLAHAGGLGVWTSAGVQNWRQGGGLAMLLTAGEVHREAATRKTCARVQTSGAACEVVQVPDLGHEYTGTYAQAVIAAFGRLVATDVRWQP
jgi:predicted esterase